MSRVLRRPMFRGGIANSEGVGITSGLDTPKRGLVDGPGGYAGKERSDIALEDVYKPYNLYGDTVRLLTNLNQAGYNYGVRPILNLPKMASNYVFGTEFEQTPEIDLSKKIIEGLSDEEIEKIREAKNKKISKFEKPTGTIYSPEPTEEVVKRTELPTLSEDIDTYSKLLMDNAGPDKDEYRRQKYLTLAKFGLNLLRQPGGLPGGKSDLLGAIAASAEKPLEGYQAIISKEQQAKRLPKALALEAAMKLSDPSDISKKIKSLAQISGLSEQQVAKSFITTGESSLKSITSTAESLAEDVGKLPALKIATTMQEAGISISQVKKLPKDTKGNIVGDKVNEGFYYDNDGTLYKFGKDKKLQPVITK